MKKLIRYLGYFRSVSEYFFAMFLSIFLKRSPKYKDLWLISERGNDARDNAYHLFKYIRQHITEQNIVYLIKKNSSDYEKVSLLGKTVEPGTFKHFLAFACSSVKISTHIMGYSPDFYLYSKLDKRNFVKGKKVFLQHGITKDFLPQFMYPNLRADLICCGAKPEFDDIKSKYGHPDGVVQLLGFCRFDNLVSKSESKRQVLVMPTWRASLRDLSEVEFMASEYYKAYQNLINSSDLISSLEKTDTTLVFYLHYELQKFSHLFSSESTRIIIADFANFDVQQLLLESNFLLTDYSSVFFDFSYMNKPMLFYQFDEETFFKEHYQKGYFSYREHAFGPVCTSQEQALSYLCNSINNGMKPDEFYSERVNNFFTLKDKKNCERTYNAIINLFN